MRLIKIDTPPMLMRLLDRRGLRLPGDALASVLFARDVAEARGVLRTVAALWRFESRRTGDRALWRAAKAAFDMAECKQVITAGEDL